MFARTDFKDSNVAENGYKFTCPVVKRDAMYIACMFMRGKHMRGQNFAAQDCKCAMRGSKCPAMRMMYEEWHTGERKYFDAESKHHRLPKHILEAIEKVILRPSHAAGLTLTDEQSKNLFDGKIIVPAEAEKMPEIIAKSTKLVKTGNKMDDLADMQGMTEMLNDSIGAE